MNSYYLVAITVVHRKPMPNGHWIEETERRFAVRSFVPKDPSTDELEAAMQFGEACHSVLRGFIRMFRKQIAL